MNKNKMIFDKYRRLRTHFCTYPPKPTSPKAEQNNLNISTQPKYPGDALAFPILWAFQFDKCTRRAPLLKNALQCNI